LFFCALVSKVESDRYGSFWLEPSITSLSRHFPVSARMSLRRKSKAGSALLPVRMVSPGLIAASRAVIE
jgi:hypothetical protein